jgi:hypothetical protein
MKTNRTVIQIGTAVFSLGLSLLAMPASLAAQKAAWDRAPRLAGGLCGPGPRRPHYSGLRRFVWTFGAACTCCV